LFNLAAAPLTTIAMNWMLAEMVNLEDTKGHVGNGPLTIKKRMTFSGPLSFTITGEWLYRQNRATFGGFTRSTKQPVTSTGLLLNNEIPFFFIMCFLACI